MDSREDIHLEDQGGLPAADSRLAAPLVGAAGDGRLHLALAVHVNDDAVLGELLLDQDHLLRALHWPMECFMARFPSPLVLRSRTL